MSRIGNNPIKIPSGVTIELKDKTVTIKGPLGTDSYKLIDGILVKQEESLLKVEIENRSQKNGEKMTAFHGLTRALLSNMVTGVSNGFEKELEIIGVGYRASQQNKDIVLQLGYSHNITFSPPDGITLEVLEPTKIKVKGINKQAVGQVAADIRELRPPEPYKGKGIRYKNEYVRRKAGKAGKK